MERRNEKKNSADFILNNQCEHNTHFPISNLQFHPIRHSLCWLSNEFKREKKKTNFKFCCISCSCPFFPVGFPICQFFFFCCRSDSVCMLVIPPKANTNPCGTSLVRLALVHNYQPPKITATRSLYHQLERRKKRKRVFMYFRLHLKLRSRETVE